ncbi:MAG: response regulator transcription factor [Bacteroidales bacterium]|nr:response regulator transcription factor [Clostridium sp.]MCM1203598.1 response regulator transcription factor [Bacteroidales bacterium]
MLKILIVEDEQPISDLIKMNLEDEGYQCTCAYDGMTAADILENRTFDLILLDIMLPQIDGYELFEYIKPLHIPVIFLTAKAALKDRVRGLNLGAEDYIVKPFEIAELLARVKVVLRRFHKSEKVLAFHDLVIDLEKKTVHRNGQFIDLTPKEFDLLVYFIRNKDMVLYRDAIYEAIWETEYDGNTRTLELHIQRLRKKTGLEHHLKTLYKSGYRLDS